IASPDTQVVQELHLVTSHLLCEYLEQELPAALAASAEPASAEPGAPGRLPSGPVRTGVEVVLDGPTGQQVDA
ncbi:phosphoheptose isomerase, partial [Micromonospora sp. ZYX-F-536]